MTFPLLRRQLTMRSLLEGLHRFSTTQLRAAAEMAGLIKEGRNQLSFVTQGEAYTDKGLLGDLISVRQCEVWFLL